MRGAKTPERLAFSPHRKPIGRDTTIEATHAVGRRVTDGMYHGKNTQPARGQLGSMLPWLAGFSGCASWAAQGWNARHASRPCIPGLSRFDLRLAAIGQVSLYVSFSHVQLTHGADQYLPKTLRSAALLSGGPHDHATTSSLGILLALECSHQAWRWGRPSEGYRRRTDDR